MKIEFDVGELLPLLGPLLDAFRPRPLPRPTPEILMTRPAYDLAVAALASRPPEFAVFLLGPRDHPLVTHVVPDTTGEGTPGSFRVGAKRLNEVLKQYAPLGLDGKGFWHSHPDGCDRLSAGDLAFVGKLFANPKNDAREVLMPITSGGRVFPFVVRRDRPNEGTAAEFVLF
jgi:proteasome lid subunit RPN8/RPN11